MSLSYREENNRRKQVQRGILDQRPVSSSKKKAPRDWLAVFWSNRDNRWTVWGDYANEEQARRQAAKLHFYFTCYVKREVYEAHYKYIHLK